MRYVSGRHAVCERARALAALEIDGELSELEVAALDRHVASCGDCETFRDQVRRWTQALRATPVERPSVAVRVAGRQRALGPVARAHALRAAGAAAAVAAAIAMSLAPVRPEPRAGARTTAPSLAASVALESRGAAVAGVGARIVELDARSGSSFLIS